MKSTPLINLRNARIDSGMTLSQVADMLHMDTKTYNNKELGKTSFTVAQGLELSHIFKQPVDVLFKVKQKN